jgi:hypothetical protein
MVLSSGCDRAPSVVSGGRPFQVARCRAVVGTVGVTITWDVECASLAETLVPRLTQGLGRHVVAEVPAGTGEPITRRVSLPQRGQPTATPTMGLQPLTLAGLYRWQHAQM